jgi:PEP-CTERM motif-containing protein
MFFDLSAGRFRVRSVFQALGASAVLCVAFAGSASATSIISGSTVNITGGVTVTPTMINFAPTFVAVPNTVAQPSEQTGSFLGATGGTIQSLTGPPLTGAVSVTDFITFTGAGFTPVMFDLTFIQPGVGTLAACSSSALGAECTPAGSPFTLIQGQGDVAVFLTLDGNSYTGTSGSGTSATVGSFTTQFTVLGTIPAVLAALVGPGGVSTSYSANFVATNPTPEPSTGTYLLFGAGLIGLSLLGRRRFHRG